MLKKFLFLTIFCFSLSYVPMAKASVSNYGAFVAITASTGLGAFYFFKKEQINNGQVNRDDVDLALIGAVGAGALGASLHGLISIKDKKINKKKLKLLGFGVTLMMPVILCACALRKTADGVMIK